MEYRKKCNVCGKIFCYTDKDVKDNLSNAGLAALESLGSLASTLGGGTIFHTSYLTGQSNRHSDKVVDFDQCPYCHSRNVSFYSGTDEAEETKTPIVKTVNINTSASAEALIKRAFIFLEDGEVKTCYVSRACFDPPSLKRYIKYSMISWVFQSFLNSLLFIFLTKLPAVLHFLTFSLHNFELIPTKKPQHIGCG